MTQRTRRDNIFDNFSNIDDYIAERDLQNPDVEDDGEMDGEGEIDSMFEHYRFPVDKGQKMLRVDKYLTQHMEKTSRHRIQLAIDAGYVRVNDKIVKANYKVKPNDLITIVMPYQRRGLEIKPENIPALFEPPPTHATTASGSSPVISTNWLLASIPTILWKSLTIIGKG